MSVKRPICGTCKWVETVDKKNSKEEISYCNALPPAGRYYPVVYLTHPCCTLYVVKE